jgi:hypothetical protein
MPFPDTRRVMSLLPPHPLGAAVRWLAPIGRWIIRERVRFTDFPEGDASLPPPPKSALLRML